jgi:hypothetical protein
VSGQIWEIQHHHDAYIIIHIYIYANYCTESIQKFWALDMFHDDLLGTKCELGQVGLVSAGLPDGKMF